MMDFRFNKEQQAFREELRQWLVRNVPEKWDDNNSQLPKEEDRINFLINWQKKLNDADWVGIQWPEEYGGRGATLVEQLIYREEMARVSPPPLINTIGVRFVGQTLLEVGTEFQKKRFVPNILSAEEIWCQGYSEPDAGSDIASLSTCAEKDGDKWFINGQKIWTSYAHVSDWCFLVTRTDSSGEKHEGITIFLVDMDQDSVQTERIHQASDEREFNQVYFDDAITNDKMIVGEVNEGWDVVMTLSSFEHSTTAAFTLEKKLSEIINYCKNTKRRGDLLIEKPQVRHKIADFEARIQAAKFTHYRNVSKQQAKGKPSPEGSMDLVVSDELREDLMSFAVNLLGPETSLWEDGSKHGEWITSFIGSYGKWIAAGTGDIQRNIIGERVLDLPKDNKSKTSHRS